MSGGVVTIGPEEALAEAAKVMVVQDVKRLPVVDDEDRLLGIISRLDIVAVFTRPDEIIEDEIREDLIRRVLFVDPDAIEVSVAGGVAHVSRRDRHQNRGKAPRGGRPAVGRRDAR